MKPTPRVWIPQIIVATRPATPTPPPPPPEALSSPSAQNTSPAPPDTSVLSEPDQFGVWREYPHPPSWVPDDFGTLEDVWEDNDALASQSSNTTYSWFSRMMATKNPFTPFANKSIYLLINWIYNSAVTKSVGDAQKLLDDVLMADGFCLEDLYGVKIKEELQRLDGEKVAAAAAKKTLAHGDAGSNSDDDMPELNNIPEEDSEWEDEGGELSDEDIIPQLPGDGWKYAQLHIPLPAAGHKQQENDAPTLRIKSMAYWPIVPLLRNFFTSTPLADLNLTTHAKFWTTPWSGEKESIVQEMYDTPVVREEFDRICEGVCRTVPPQHDSDDIPIYQEIRHRSPPPDPPSESRLAMENVVAIMMLWSDSTHLANFGTASLWPIYMFLGNTSKYKHAKPSSFSAMHVAYIPSVSNCPKLALFRKADSSCAL